MEFSREDLAKIPMQPEIHYRSNLKITALQFIDLLQRSTLDQRRPVNDPERIQQMLDHGNVLITAWAGTKLIGVSRALTDFSFCCYLSDLAVDEEFQHQGIGKKMIALTHEASGDKTMLILLAAPAAEKYYPKIGMTHHNHCYFIKRKI
jgi:ribosomal protein S18 acetylase RimI-like enzyme